MTSNPFQARLQKAAQEGYTTPDRGGRRLPPGATYPARVAGVPTAKKPISPRQLDFLRKLNDEIADALESVGDYQGAEDLRSISLSGLTSAQASQEIDAAMARVKDIRKLLAESKTADWLDDGVYRNQAGDVVMVYHTIHGANIQVGKVWAGEIDGFVYRGRAALRGLTLAHRMTLDEAAEFGRVYGVCCVCALPLTNEESKAKGIGPICETRF